ncbi:MAG: GlsB/YeaQ/YmgE family stress response membrane protein [Saprospiraceae bacterium]|nr:GlsB/YeaQ/YmgE family stress response membrane protein [Saprospiraceae bacterium]
MTLGSLSRIIDVDNFSKHYKINIIMTIESILIWCLLGAVAGWLAGQIMKGRGFGTIGNIVIGILGSFLGGWLAGQLGIAGAATGGFSIPSILTALGGAIVLLFLVGLVKKS